MSKSGWSPLAKLWRVIGEGIVDDTKVIAKAPNQNVGESLVDVEVDGGAPRWYIGTGFDVTKVDGEAPRWNVGGSIASDAEG